jgi:cytidyltransferase-like protein
VISAKLSAGSIHGRFQPFHNGHLEYLKGALDRCDYLYIGITQFRRRNLVQVESAAATHRAQPESNPLSYFERVNMVQSVLRSMCVGPDHYCIVPFPIEDPSELHDFLSTTVTVFTTTYDAWNERKIEILRGLGYTVVNLWSRQHKAVAGQDLRRLLRDGDPTWRTFVPTAVARTLDELQIAERLRALVPQGDS